MKINILILVLMVGMLACSYFFGYRPLVQSIPASPIPTWSQKFHAEDKPEPDYFAPVAPVKAAPPPVIIKHKPKPKDCLYFNDGSSLCQ